MRLSMPPTRASRRRMTVAIALVTLALVIAVPATAARPPNPAPGTVDVQLLAINDFHGNLLPPTGSGGRIGSAASDALCVPTSNCVLAGGFSYLAPFHHVPSYAFYSDARGFSPRHLSLAHEAIAATGAPGALHVSDSASLAAPLPIRRSRG